MYAISAKIKRIREQLNGLQGGNDEACLEGICFNVLFKCQKVAFSALTLLVVQQEDHLAFKKLSDEGMVICLQGGGNELHMVQLIQLMPLPPHHRLLHYNPEWFCFTGSGLPRLSWKQASLSLFSLLL